MKVKDVMTKRLITVKSTDTLGTVVGVLADKNISGCPVTRGGKLVGVVTQTDVVRALNVYDKINKQASIGFILSMIKSKDSKNEIQKLLNTRVKVFMNDKAIAIDTEEDIYKAAALMHKHNIDRLPALKSGKLAGIITKRDIVKFLKNMESGAQ